MNIVQKPEKMQEKEYRSLCLNSYSSLKKYDLNRLAFYKEFILKDKLAKDETTKDMIVGSLVHLLLLNPEDFDNKFVISTVGEIDKDANQPSYFAWKIWEKTQQCLDENGDITREFLSIVEEAFSESKYNYKGEEVRFKGKDLEYALSKFEGSDMELWYKQKRESVGKSLVSIQDIENAEKIVNELKSNPNTVDIINQETGNGVVVYNEWPIFFEHGNTQLKMMADKIIVDHNDKTIKPYDPKVTYEVENFPYIYRKNYYYLQAALYDLGIRNWAKQEGWSDYEIFPMGFIATHSFGQLQSLVYQLEAQDLQKGRDGFIVSGRYYSGLNEILEGLNWHLESSEWGISYKNWKNKGICSLNLNYENK